MDRDDVAAKGVEVGVEDVHCAVGGIDQGEWSKNRDPRKKQVQKSELAEELQATHVTGDFDTEAQEKAFEPGHASAVASAPTGKG